jgi:hypothetical protein
MYVELNEKTKEAAWTIPVRWIMQWHYDRVRWATLERADAK